MKKNCGSEEVYTTLCFEALTILSVYTLQKKMQVLTPMFSKNIDLKQKKQITGMKKLTNS